MAYTIIVAGTSEPFDFVLKNNGIALNGTGLTVTLEIKKAGVVPPSPPSVEWLNQSAGTVRVTGLQTLALGTYKVRYRLTDAGALIGFAPNQLEPDVWNVVKVQP